MPLTAETMAILKARAEAGAPEFHELTPQQARETFAQMRALLSGEPEAVARVEDRRIPGPVGDIPIRVYQPAGAGPFPVLVYLHGGGWVIGDIETHDGPCRSLTNLSGCCVVSVDYRLAPDARYPAAADDCYAATVWVADNAGELRVDASRVAVGGVSAGGNLAAVVSLMARDKGRPEIRSQVLMNPVTDFSFETASYKEHGEGLDLSEASMRWFWDCYLESPDHGSQPYASPLRADDLQGLPRALVITSEYDPLRDEGEAYGEGLRAAGVPTTITRYEGVLHGFVGQAPDVPEGRQALEQIGRELRDALA